VTFRGISGTEHEADLIRKAQAGDVRARNALVEAHLPMIRKITGKVVGTADTDEFLSHGVEGFLKGIESFDPERGFRLLTYAGKAVWQTVVRAKQTDGLIWTPPPSQKDQHERHTERISNARRPLSLNAPVSNGEGEMCQFVCASHDRDVADSEERTLERVALDSAMVRLDPRLRDVLDERLRGVTLAEIGERIGKTKEWVRRLEEKAVEELRRLIAEPEPTPEVMEETVMPERPPAKVRLPKITSEQVDDAGTSLRRFTVMELVRECRRQWPEDEVSIASYYTALHRAIRRGRFKSLGKHGPSTVYAVADYEGPLNAASTAPVVAALPEPPAALPTVTTVTTPEPVVTDTDAVTAAMGAVERSRVGLLAERDEAMRRVDAIDQLLLDLDADAAALSRVRDRGLLGTPPVAEPSHPPDTRPTTKRYGGNSNVTPEDVIRARVEKALPNPGDQIDLVKLFPAGTVRLRAMDIMAGMPHIEVVRIQRFAGKRHVRVVRRRADAGKSDATRVVPRLAS
jgi:RNA polymerase sigma factor (sigma-70 family)